VIADLFRQTLSETTAVHETVQHVNAPSGSTPRVQEVRTLLRVLCDLLERALS
jgi:hypothetical protein